MSLQTHAISLKVTFSTTAPYPCGTFHTLHTNAYLPLRTVGTVECGFDAPSKSSVHHVRLKAIHDHDSAAYHADAGSLRRMAMVACYEARAIRQRRTRAPGPMLHVPSTWSTTWSTWIHLQGSTRGCPVAAHAPSASPSGHRVLRRQPSTPCCPITLQTHYFAARTGLRSSV